MTTNDDDFWGNQAEWPDVPEDERKAPRPHGGARVSGQVSRWWNRIVGGGVEGTRQHGRHVTASHAHDDWDADDYDLTPEEPIAEPDPVRHAAAEATNSTNPTAPANQAGIDDETWDDEWVIESDPTPSPGVDPLLARLGGLAIVTTLLVPLALGLRSHDESPSATDVTNAVVTMTAPVDTTVPAAAAAQTVAPDTAAATSAASSAPVVASTEPAPATTTPATSAPVSAADQSAELNATAPNAAAPNSGGVTTSAVADEVADRERSCAIDYEVVEGDFWIRLADASGLPLDEILDANDATVDTPLFPGATICLPDGATVPAPPTTAPATTTPATTPAAPPATTKPVTTTAPPTTAKPVVTYPPISAAAAVADHP